VTIRHGGFYSGTAGWGIGGGGHYAVTESRRVVPTDKRRVVGNGPAAVHTGGRCAGALSVPNRGGRGSLTRGPRYSPGRRRFEFISNSNSKRVRI
jgi:hypothetical protein